MLLLILAAFAFTIATFPWLLFEVTVQSVQLAARSLSIFNLDLRNFWFPCLMKDQYLLALAFRLLVPLGVVALTYIVPLLRPNLAGHRGTPDGQLQPTAPPPATCYIHRPQANAAPLMDAGALDLFPSRHRRLSRRL